MSFGAVDVAVIVYVPGVVGSCQFTPVLPSVQLRPEMNVGVNDPRVTALLGVAAPVCKWDFEQVA